MFTVRIIGIVCLMAFVVPSQVSAFEIGANLLSIRALRAEAEGAGSALRAEAEGSVTFINLGSLLTTNPALYISGSISDQVALDLALGFFSITNEGSTTVWTGQSGITYFLQRRKNAPYVKSLLAILGSSASGSFSDSSFGAGVGIGYRHVVQNIMALRFEAGYVRWFEEDVPVNDIKIHMSFGVVLGGK